MGEPKFNRPFPQKRRLSWREFWLALGVAAILACFFAVRWMGGRYVPGRELAQLYPAELVETATLEKVRTLGTLQEVEAAVQLSQEELGRFSASLEESRAWRTSGGRTRGEWHYVLTCFDSQGRQVFCARFYQDNRLEMDAPREEGFSASLLLGAPPGELFEELLP